MELQECNTVKSCLFWAEQRWSGFWDFATQQPMTTEEILTLSEELHDDDEGFQQLAERLIEVGKIDKSKEAKNLIIKVREHL